MGQKDRPNYWKNAALLTGSDVVLRLAGLGLRIGLANALGGEGMGLYQLVLAVYGLFVTLATAGISVAATRLLTEELSRDAASARGMLRRLLALGAGLGVLAMAAQAGLAGLAAKWWLGDVRAAGALRLSALGLPWMAVSAVLRGFWPGGGWAPTWPVSWPSRRCASGRWRRPCTPHRAGMPGSAARWCWGPPP